MGDTPKLLRKLFISAPGRSPKIRRKVIPATTTQTSAGRNRDERKKPLATIFLEFRSTARSIGTGIRIRQVKNV